MTNLDDPARLAAVERLSRMTLPIEEIVGVLQRLAERVGGVPLTAATYLDDSTQHFIATNAGPKDEMPRDVSHCQYVISSGAFLCIRDASSPESPWSKLKRSLIEGKPLAAYLGFPLRYDGHTVGAVCAVDNRPRQWTADDQYAVYTAAREIRGLIEHGR